LTWDEPSFISAGYAYLTRGEFRFNPSHPPLLQVLEAAPLVLTGVRAPEQPFEFWRGNSANPVVPFGQALIFDSGNDPIRLAEWARLPILIIGSALVVWIFLWGRRLYGPWPALLGTALAATCPNLIAHAGLATEDLGCSALVFAAAWTFWLAYRDGGPWRWGRCGAVTGLALVSKYTALVILPSFLFIAALTVLSRRSRLTSTEWLRALAIVSTVAAAVVLVAYGPRFGWLLYLQGLQSIYGDAAAASYEYYLAGSFSQTATWYYTLAAFVFKVSVTTITLLLFALAVVLRPGNDRDDVVFVLLPAAAIIVVSFFDPANLGLRRILPAFPFLYLFASRVFARSWGRLHTIVLAAAIALVVWTARETLRIYPHHLSYFSAAVGGPLNGPNLLDDSNIDWGQDLPALAAWQREHPEADVVRLAYFGTAVPAAYGVHATMLEDIRALVDPAPGTYAISVHLLVRLKQLASRGDARLDWLSRYRPVGRAGYSIYIYRVT